MAHLFTHHDRHRVHAILGSLVLLHFVVRWTMLCVSGDAFVNREASLLNLVGVFLHMALPLSSLRLPIPTARNHTAPIIWHEFRLHSIIFATRHVLCTVLALVFPACRAMSLTIVHLTLHAASWAQDHLGDAQRRTTNAMPYAAGLSNLESQHTKNMYARAQFMATAFSIADHPSLRFMPLLGIQASPLLMTLVHKGKIGAASYHRVYAWTLLMPLLATMFIAHRDRFDRADDIGLSFVIGIVSHFLRVELKLGKHATWCLAPAIGYMCEPHIALFVRSYRRLSVFALDCLVLAGLGRNLHLIPNILYANHRGKKK